MGRLDQPPFARGETYANGNLEILNAANGPFGLGGINLEGKIFVFEPNSDATTTLYGQLGPDPNGRAITVRVVRNVSGQALLPKRLVRYQLATTNVNLETHIDGYTIGAGDVPAGIVDEFLPPAGVANEDLFYLVIDGPTIGVSLTTGTVSIAHGSVLVPGLGTSKTTADAGCLDSQVLTGATATLADQIQNSVGRSGRDRDHHREHGQRAGRGPSAKLTSERFMGGRARQRGHRNGASKGQRV